MQLFDTDRLRVRQFVADDLDNFAALCASPDVMRLMGDGTTLPRETVSHWIDVCQVKYRERGYGTSAIFEKASGKFIGYCRVVRAPDRDFDEVIYAFLPTHWGRGYATEVGRGMLAYVFGISHLDAIYATIHERHAASQHVAAKLGMQFVRRESEADGDTLVYRLQRTDFVEP